MKRIASHRMEVLARFERRHLSRRIKQIEVLLDTAGRLEHDAFFPLFYHLNRCEQAHAKICAGLRVRR
jgi:hypothetical protein